jgi:hypothetical protein
MQEETEKFQKERKRKENRNTGSSKGKSWKRKYAKGESS